MKITLISPYPDVTSFGVRTIAAYLKQHGHPTQLIFLPDPRGDDLATDREWYPEMVLDQVVQLVRDSGVIGITLMTNYFDGAVQITDRLKAAGITAPIVWGGVHPTIKPEESIAHADLICIGDGEDALLDLVERMSSGADYTDTPNFWIKNGTTIHRNPVRPLPHDLDLYPRPDYSMEDHHIMHQGVVKPFTGELLQEFLSQGTVSTYVGRIGYQTMTGRGCPHKCSYCINDAVKELYGAKGYLRWRSTRHIIDEFVAIRQQFPFIDFIWISDDAFLSKNRASIREFCAEYQPRVGVPFSCLASPLTISEEKMDLLVDAGLIYIQMGIQSGSPRVQELFNRKKMDNERVLAATRIINKYRDRMVPPSYDFILDVPHETEEDTIESLKLIAELPRPYKLQPFSLVLYPGTRLYEMSKEQGLIHDERSEIYAKSYTMREPNYLNFLITLAKTGKFPGKLLKFMVSSPMVRVFNHRWMKPLVRSLYVGMRTTYRSFKLVAGRA